MLLASVAIEEERRRFGDGCSSALAVVEGEASVTYLCLRDPDSRYDPLLD